MSFCNAFFYSQSTFAEYESCQSYVGDGKKLCGQLTGEFGACIDSQSDCSLIGAYAVS